MSLKTLLLAAVQAMSLPLATEAQVGERRWSEPMPLGAGTARAFVRSGPSAPSEVGVVFDEAALEGLPNDVSSWPWNIYDAAGQLVTPCCGAETLMRFPDSCGEQPFDHVVVNWMPTGHGPAGVYDHPHFDIHFYLITPEQRAEIAIPSAEERCSVNGQLVPLSCEMYARATVPLPTAMEPPGYTDIGSARPGMGNHLYDLSAPEHHGHTFARTFLFGKFDGSLIFMEPMITHQFFTELSGEECHAIAMPGAMPESGWYPTRYCMRRDHACGEIEVRMDAFRLFPAAAAVDGCYEAQATSTDAPGSSSQAHGGVGHP